MSLTHTTGLLLLTLLLLLKPRKTLRYAHSLCLNLAVTSQSRPRQPGVKSRAQWTQSLSSSMTVTATRSQLRAPWGEVNGTKAWSDLTGTLGGVGESSGWSCMSSLGTEKTTGAPRLQAKLCCQLEAERVTAASWHFSLDGQTALLLDAMDMNWTVVNPGATGIKEQWKLTVGDCGHWLREFLGHWENVLEQEPTEPPLEPSDNQQLPAWIIPRSGLTVIVVLVLVVIVLIIVIVIRRCDGRSGTTAGEKQAGLRLLGSACSGKGLGDLSPALTQALCTDPLYTRCWLLCLEPHSAQRGWGLLGSWGRRGCGGGTSHVSITWGAGTGRV
uniref:MHC class I-like antigen recognition-like domain-containing protein n=1 Tax=Sus scrofa TaxID=9823 RepID=A0A5G2QZN2_PIG